MIWGDDAPTAGDPTPQDSANGGDDVLSGLGGNEVFYGGAGDDTVSAGGGDDYAWTPWVEATATIVCMAAAATMP